MLIARTWSPPAVAMADGLISQLLSAKRRLTAGSRMRPGTHRGEIAPEAPGRRQHAGEQDREQDERAGQRDEGEAPAPAGSADPVLPRPGDPAGMQEVDVKARALDRPHPHNPRSASPNAWRN